MRASCGAGLGAAALMLVAVLPTEARHRVLTLTGITSDQSGAYRLALWQDTLRLAASSPAIGSGFGAYEDALPRFKTTAGGFRVLRTSQGPLGPRPRALGIYRKHFGQRPARRIG